jgi:hypothetical protein
MLANGSFSGFEQPGAICHRHRAGGPTDAPPN